MKRDRDALLRACAGCNVETVYREGLENAEKERDEAIKQANEKFANIVARGKNERATKIACQILVDLMDGRAVAMPDFNCEGVGFLPFEDSEQRNQECLREIFGIILTDDECKELYELLKERCAWDTYLAECEIEAEFGGESFEDLECTNYTYFDEDGQYLEGKKVVLADSVSWDELWDEELEKTDPDDFERWEDDRRFGSCIGELTLQCVYFK